MRLTHPRREVLNFPDIELPPASADELRAEAEALWFALPGCYRGVFSSTDRREALWYACLGNQSSKGPQDIPNIFISRASTDEMAAEYHDRSALFYFGDDAILNFPERRASYIPTPKELLRGEFRRLFKSTTSSRFQGVTKRKDGSWFMVMKYKGKQSMTICDSEEEAARFYQERQLELNGRMAYFNFHPMTGEEICGRKLTDEEWAAFETSHMKRAS